MNKGGFSWSRLLGISAFKAKISRSIGVPLTRSGRQRKVGALVIRAVIATLLIVLSWLLSPTFFEKIKPFLIQH